MLLWELLHGLGYAPPIWILRWFWSWSRYVHAGAMTVTLYEAEVLVSNDRLVVALRVCLSHNFQEWVAPSSMWSGRGAKGLSKLKGASEEAMLQLISCRALHIWSAWAAQKKDYCFQDFER